MSNLKSDWLACYDLIGGEGNSHWQFIKDGTTGLRKSFEGYSVVYREELTTGLDMVQCVKVGVNHFM